MVRYIVMSLEALAFSFKGPLGLLLYFTQVNVLTSGIRNTGQQVHYL